MAVTVGRLGPNPWIAHNNTVSSAPVTRLREQERSNTSLIGNDPMEAGRSNRNRKDDQSSATWINPSFESKKDKKWSIGKLFRRKKKESDSDSGSSDDNSQRQNGGKKKPSKKHRSKELDDNNRSNHRSQSVTKITKKEYYDEGVLSDPSAGFVGYVGRGLPRSPFDRSHRSSKESLDKRGPESSCGSQDGSLRKGRKGRLKARVEAIRNMKNESSSDEESQRSTSSSIMRFKSDDSLANNSKSDLTSKRSRSARTDRYIKRLSRDEEVTNEKESETIQKILSKMDSESFSQRQRILSSPQINGSVVSSRDEVEYCEPHRVYQNTIKPERSLSGTHLAGVGLGHGRSNLKPSYVTGSNSSVYSYPAGIISLNAKVNNENISYSIPYSNLNKKQNSVVNPNKNLNQPRPTTDNNNGRYTPSYENEDVMVVKFPLGNMTTAKRDNIVPPVPPPRDPQRKVSTPLSYMYDNTRPLSYNFDSNPQKNAQSRTGENRSNISTPNNFASQNIYENGAQQKQEGNLTWNKRPISTSEDHIAMQQTYQNIAPQYYHNSQPKRPSSVTAEIIRPDVYNRYINRPQINQDSTIRNQTRKPTPEPQDQNYLYYADRTPRSRKPIHITPGSITDPQTHTGPTKRPQNASEFWKKMENREIERRKQVVPNRTQSDLGLNGNISNPNTLRKSLVFSHTNNNIQPPILRNGDIPRNKVENRSKTMSCITDPINNGYTTNNVKKEEPICYSNIDIIPMDDIRKEKNKSGHNFDDDSKGRKKSTNLDDALSELEAIYNSLGLGDEDLLDRAEKRELMSPKTTESFPFNISQTDYLRHPNYSGLNEFFPNRNPISRRSSTPDKLHDDMAFRRLNPHERPKSKDVNSLVSQISYMLASPVLMEPMDCVPKPESRKSEPDIVLDDVAFRNIRQANNYLKIVDPQPPFGIPLGPVSPSPYSNYLLGPDVKEKNKQYNPEPDVVKDDLAYRALRKDCKSVTYNEDDLNDMNKYHNQNITEPSAIFDNHVIKKKRAVRSLSANIFTMIQKEIDDALDLYNNKPLEKTKSIPDLPEAVVEFGKNGKMPNNFKPSPETKDINNTSSNKSKFLNQSHDCRSFINGNINNISYTNTEKFNIPYGLNFEKSKDPSGLSSKPISSNEMYHKSKESDTKVNKHPVKITVENKFKSSSQPSDKNKYSVDYSTTVYSTNSPNVSISHKTNISQDKLPEPAKRNLSPGKNKKQESSEPPPKNTGQSTEDSLIQISNHLNKLGDRLKPNSETQNNFEEEGMKLKALAMKCNINLDKNNTVETFNIRPSQNNRDMPLNQQEIKIPQTNKFEEDETSAPETLEKMPSFEDLRKGINDLLHGISQVTDRLNLQKSNEAINSKTNDGINEIGKESPLPDEDTDKSKDNRGSPEYNSSEELAMIFNLNKDDTATKPKPTTSEFTNNGNTGDKHLDLNSPRLVKTAHQNFVRQSSVERDIKEGESSKQLTTNDFSSNNVPWRRHSRQSSKDNETKGNVQDHEDFHRREVRREDIPVFDKPSIFHSTSAFRPVKPRSAARVVPKNVSKYRREKPFFEDIKIIARGFGDIIEYSDRRTRRDDNVEFFGGYSQDDCLTANLTPLGRLRKVKKRSERRVTVHECEADAGRQYKSADMPEAKLDSIAPKIMGDSTERIRKYKEERRKQLAEQSRITTRSQRQPSRKSDETQNAESPTTSGMVRTTRTSRLRAAASADTTTASPKPRDKTSPKSIKAQKNVFVDSTNHNQQVLSSSLVLVNTSDLGKENGHSCGKDDARTTKCDIDTVIDNISNKLLTVQVDEPSRIAATKMNGGSQGASSNPAKAKQPTRSRVGVGDDQPRKGRTSKSKVDNGNSSDSTPTFDKSGCNIKNGALGKLNGRSSSQSPLSSARVQQKRRSADFGSKTPVNTSATEIELKTIALKEPDRNFSPKVKSESKTIDKTKGKRNDTRRDSTKCSGDSSSEAELNRAKRRSSSVASDSRISSGKSKKSEDMAPGVDKGLKNKLIANSNVDRDGFIKSSSLDNPYSKLNGARAANRRLTSRMDALEALTKETFAKVNRLAKKVPDSHNSSSKNAFINSKVDSKKTVEDVRLKDAEVSSSNLPSTSRRSIEADSTSHLPDAQCSISSSCDDKVSEPIRKSSEPAISMLSYTPISILKRKSLQEEHGSSGTSSGNVATPPVTFSPSVVDPPESRSRRYGQGILKKRRSLDESQVNRHRSCSPEVAFADECRSRPILKGQRRSSLEEVVRGRSPDAQIQGILKRKSSRDGDFVEDRSLGSPEPQGILKRKSNSSSSSSTTSSHVSIAQAVILAAAKGAVLVEDKDSVRPILKKKSFSEEKPCPEIFNIDGPKPILKKKSLTESDHSDHDKPTKTILKHKFNADDGNSSSFDHSEDDRSLRWSNVVKQKTIDGEDREQGAMRPILKQRGQSRDPSQSPKQRYSLCSDDEANAAPQDDADTVAPLELNNRLSLRISPGSPQRQSDDEDLPKNSKFTLDRLQSPSLVKEFFEMPVETQSTHFASAVRRRELRSRNRSRSLVSRFSGELDHVLLARRSYVDEASRDMAGSSGESSTDEPANEAKSVQRFPSIAEKIQCMEQFMKKDPKKSLGAVPKRQFRNGERFKTQPVTIEELHNVSSLDVGQANFQRHVADHGTSVNVPGPLVSRQEPKEEDILAKRQARGDHPPYPSQPLSLRIRRNSDLNTPPCRDPHAKLRNFDEYASSPPAVRAFDDLTFTPETLRSFSRDDSVTASGRRADNDDETSPVTREFNRLFNKYDSKSFDSPARPNESYRLKESKLASRIDDPDGSVLKTKIERPTKLFEGETSYQKGSREAVLQELDRLEIELEDVRVALDADSTALCGIDPDHWSLNVSVDSGVFNRMSSGDSGPLSGEEHSLHHDVYKQVTPDTKLNRLSSLGMEKTMNKHGQKGPTELEKMNQTSSSFEISDEINTMKEPSPETVADNPQELFGLMKSNSVSARASMWQQMHLQANKAAVKPFARNARSKAKDSSVLDRFKTQPITLGEVTDATRETTPIPLNQSSSSFNVSLDHDEDGDNFRSAQNKLAEQASRMLTTEVKGILKSRSGAIPLLPSLAANKNEDSNRNSITSLANNKISDDHGNTVVSQKGRNAEGLKDEGIESSSDDESALHSSQSSDDSCSSSESSDESENDKEPSPPPSNIKPSQLKGSKTESDIAKRSPRDSTKQDLGIKLPCMDEMRARQIMERCMAKSEKENAQKPKILVSQHPKKILPNDPLQTKTNNEQDESAFVKVRNLKNGNISALKSPIISDTLNVDNNNTIAANLVKKYFSPSVSKSRSVHTFNAPPSCQLRPLDSLKPPSKLRGSNSEKCEGSESDGESSGGREVRQITSRRRNIKGQQVAPLAAGPAKGSQDCVPFPGLRRSATQPMAAAMPQQGSTIAERLKALQQSGNNDWRKRVSRLSPDEDVTNVITATKNRINETLTQQHEEIRKAAQIDPSELASDLLISDRRTQLETSAQGWKKRVGQNDATLFSVAGRMDRDKVSPPTTALLPTLETPEKKTPIATRFKSRRIEANAGPLKSASSAAVSQPASPLKRGIDFKRSISVSGVDDLATENNDVDNVMAKSQDDSCTGPRPSVPVPRADDETFTSFYTSASQMVLTSSSSYITYSNNNNDIPQIDEDIDLDVIDSSTRHLLGGAGANRVRAARRAGGSRNPLRALAARTDLLQEYTEPPSTGLADKETARLKKDKLAANSPMAIEALAGLASREDFANIHLKKATPSSPPWTMAQASQKMLIHIKGRRRVQARLVEPHYNSINSGDCFILVTNDQVYLYIGYYANVIERTRGAEIALHIHTHKDLGCSNSTSVITLDELSKNRSARYLKQFWNLLGLPEGIEDYTPTPAGNADEDEIFESGIIPTNMCYEVYDDELVPIQEYWGQIPKIAMLDPSKILVFDFGSELYVWNGKNTILEKRRTAFQLAQELWDEGYDYKDCAMCPINTSQVLGARKEIKETDRTSNKRPDWAMLAKVTQHMENILFRDKFLDWPDFTRVIKVKEEECLKNGSSEIKPFDAEVMWKNQCEEPSLELEGSQVGRGTHYYDKETMRHFEVKTQSITKWMIQEYDYVKINKNLGEFYSADSYIIRWEYQLNVTGRELTGKPSKHNLTGRDRCAYFCWQGKDASPNEKGAAALLTVELDQEKGPQVRVSQGSEPPAFLNLFKGSLIIHQGKKGNDDNRYKLYMTRGNIVNESHAIQVTCSMRQLRSRTSMLLVDTHKGQIYVWHGAKSLKHTKSIALDVASQMAFNCNPDLFSSDVVEVKITEISEGDEPNGVIDALGGANRQLYHSLVDNDNKIMDDAIVTPRLFHFTDLSGEFIANEIVSPLRHADLVTPYPFSQKELYSASQPGLFMLDDGKVLWLWQGWVPQNEESDAVEAGAGSGNIRWQLCRKAAMETVLNYWQVAYPQKNDSQAFLTVAGLEPLQFTNLFDIWQDRDDIAEINMEHGYKMGEGSCSVSEELCRLSRTSFPLAVLRQRPLPDGVDPAHIERYLTAPQFQETFGMCKEDFYELPSWKQVNMKKDLGLF